MKRSIVTILILIPFVSVLAYANPGKPTGFVNDFAGIIDQPTKQTIESKLRSLQASTSAQVAVVTVGSLGGDTIENYAAKLFADWGIGEKGKDNGLLILVASSDREARIEVGYGLEGDVTDLQSGLIVRNVMIPAFKAGDYSKGISEAVDAVSALIEKSPEAAALYSSPDNLGSSDSSSSTAFPKVNLFSLLFFIIIVFNLLARILGRTKSWWLGGVLGAIVGTIIGLIWGFIYAGAISITALTILGLIFDYIVSKKGPPKGPGRGGFWFFGPGMMGGGHNGGLGSGGFGGFGGGFSGGGGASGKW